MIASKRIVSSLAMLAWVWANPLMAEGPALDIWQPGRTREVFLHGLTNDVATLTAWAGAGANSCLGVEPAAAHKAGLKARAWFVMNCMDERSLGADKIKQMAATARDRSFIRPSEPLFPDVEKYGWVACVNNPQWREHGAAVVAKMAQEDYDGCHVDTVGQSGPCFCQHCKSRWQEWSKQHELTAAADLETAADAKDFRTRTLLREFRTRCTMEFLQLFRDAARKAKPAFALGSTFRQDAASLYQCAYGDHVKLACIEGTTWGEFPPASQQLLWLKLVRAVGRGKVPMAVSYHTLRDASGNSRRARMATDRLGVALAEIFAAGGTSLLGWAGPGADNLLREHESKVRGFYSLAAELEPALAEAKPMAWLAVVFSPRSYFVSGQARAQYYTLGQGLMKAHIPFAVVSDVDLTTEQLRAFTGVILPEASALSDAAIGALDGYVKAGGKLMVIGDDAGKYDKDWKERTPPPPWAAVSDKPRAHGQGMIHPVQDEFLSGRTLGATQSVLLKQDRPESFVVEGWSYAKDVVGQRGPDYAITVDLYYTDNSSLTGLAGEFSTGSHDWEFQRLMIKPEKPVRRATVRLLFRGRAGTVWFREVRLGEWNPKTQRMSRNLLGTTLRLANGKTYTAKPIQDGDKGTWQPLRDGFVVETLPGFSHVMKMSSAGGLPVGQMHVPQPDIAQRVRQLVAPLLPPQPLLTVEGPGAENVHCDTGYTGDRLLLQFINYNAQLHPDQPETEQQKNDKTIPVTGLKVTLSLNLHPTGATWSAPGIAAQSLPIMPPLSFSLPRLDQWGVATVQLK